MIAQSNHPQRLALADELHARPFQPASAPGRVITLAFKQPVAAAQRDPETDRAHFDALLDRLGADHPPPSVRHHVAEGEGFSVKWECHTEFVSYHIQQTGPASQLFDADVLQLLDPDWIETAPGALIAATMCEVVDARDMERPLDLLIAGLADEFHAESLACSQVIDGQALAISDFRVRADGLTRMALVICQNTGPRRIGRMVQRLAEIEVYRAMSMLALPIAREIQPDLNRIEDTLSAQVQAAASGTAETTDARVLSHLMDLAAEIEALSTRTAFRFDAATAYEQIVTERIEVLREVPVHGRQQFREFMQRRYNPAIRTVYAARSRLDRLAVRVTRAADLLRTRVDVTLESQNKELLESMDRRAALQLRLQETVEGLSIVAISYYAVSLAGYVAMPLAKRMGLDKTTAMAVLAVPVVACVWFFIRRLRKRLEQK